jgi:AcrR family transcriptional regulator
VPKRVDHEERRRQITGALLRVAAVKGLHATGIREVAAEARVSVRLVQYYFGTKEELLLAATHELAVRYAERALARARRTAAEQAAARGVASLPTAGPRDVVAAILAEGVPRDEESRALTVVYTAYLALSLTDPALAIAPLLKDTTPLIGVIASQLRAAQEAGDAPEHLDPAAEALSLIAMSAGLSTSVITGQSTPVQAQDVIDYHLNRLFPGSGTTAFRASSA